VEFREKGFASDSRAVMLAYPSYWHRTALEGETVDYLIVGAGIAGVSTALALREARADARVMLVDPHGVAGIASGRNAGFLISSSAENYAESVRMFGRDRARALREFNIASAARLRRLARELGVADAWMEPGAWVVAGSAEEDAQLRESAVLLAEDGAPAQYHERFPFGRGFLGALHHPEDTGLHPVKLLRGLARAAGLRVEQATVDAIVANDNHRGGFRVETDQGTIAAAEVLVCVNAFLPHLVPAAAGWVRPVRGQVLLTEPIAARLLEGVCYANAGFDYFRQLPDGRVLMGGRRHLHIPQEVGYDLAPSAALQADLETFLRTHFAELADGFRVDFRWAGTMGFSATDLPIITRTADGIHLAAGFTGHGMGYGAQAGFALAELVLGRGTLDLFAPPPAPPPGADS
jgi:glycine/D-amino acid oxidase-like deaminating enzyme